ncbi:bifunctional methylenetetrahydrofolate dehydrogenase/cyclohydrolase, mitochondrial isoform X1 [Photinus pyralis]|uniref:bifunctional methylenetetrahydrofolate dehydrogenase/cyclohydrolase, mitochondrial isoform X1 n=1 Tax=Photinus pyralis TaxID=7054 RepID=UPI00126753E8|nr:bifunctional methylenetetrahydrofolate dehydrogenase/cyclohydrolase, mitochondrial isoform X1 [Photinus pyralis]
MHRFLNIIKHYSYCNRIQTCSRNKMVQIINGRNIADEIQNTLRCDINAWVKTSGRKPSLVAVLVGDDPASIKYVEKKMEAAAYVGIDSKIEKLPDTISEVELISKIQQLNGDVSVDGILVQLPVPPQISERNVCNAVDPIKDVDGFHYSNAGKLCLNMESFVPCTVLAVIEVLKRAGVETFAKNVVVVGRSKHIGLPLSVILNSDARNELPGLEATVTVCHRNTPPEQLCIFTKLADIIISATGVVHLIKEDMVKPGACVIDVGMTRITTAEGKVRLVGDVDFDNVKNVAECITPVPGGVGPVTVAMLMKNTFKAAKMHVS